jgi:hypothetical protein
LRIAPSLAIAVLQLWACGGAGSASSSNAPPPGSISPTPAPSQSPGGVAGPSSIPACPSVGTPLFDSLPIDPASFLAFRPLGFLSPPIHMFPAKHSAFSMTLPGATATPVPVRSPGRVWVTEIWEATFSTGGANYQIYLYPCADVRVYFGHIATLSDRLKSEMEKSPATCNSFQDGSSTVTTCRHTNLSVALESGEPLGAGPDTAGVDFGVMDRRKPPAAFIRLDHYDSFYPYWASPLDYFEPAPRALLEGKTGHVFGTRFRTAPPIGGTFMQDLPGAAQGNWFLPGKYHVNTADLSGFLGLSTDYVDPSQPIMAIGTSVVGVTMGLYSFTPETQGGVNRRFADVKADGSTYCYDRFLQGQTSGGLPLGRPNGVLLLSLPSDTTLRMQLVSGTSCVSANPVMTSAATTFER